MKTPQNAFWGHVFSRLTRISCSLYYGTKINQRHRLERHCAPHPNRSGWCIGNQGNDSRNGIGVGRWRNCNPRRSYLECRCKTESSLNALLAALAAIPQIANSLEALARSFAIINARAIKAQAAKRRSQKDSDVDSRIAALVDVHGVHPNKAEQRRTADEQERFCCGCNCCAEWTRAALRVINGLEEQLEARP